MKRLMFWKNESHPTDTLIEAVIERLREVGPDSDEYPRLLAYLERLTGVKVEERRDPFNWDRVILVVGNLAGVLLIIVYEQNHSMLSKGWSWINRPRPD